ncbi:FecR domain-containing protein [Candidatus Omnitrophota bacterium]
MAALLILTSLGAEEEMRKAKVLDMQGNIVLIRGEEKLPLEVGMEVLQGDVLVTKADSWAFVKIDGIKQARVELKENSQLLFLEMVMDKEKERQNTLLDLAIGRVLVRVEEVPGEDSKFEVKTPTTLIGTMGKGESSFSVEVESIE